MDLDKCSPIDRQSIVPGAGAIGENKRRTRLDKGLPEELGAWIRRTIRVHAHLLAIVRLYGSPEKAGGQSLEGEAYAARAARGDRTMLYDALSVARDEIDGIRSEIETVMDAAPPTIHPPGSPGKVEIMAERMFRGESIFIDGDAEAGDR
jgi:hypothetical protein